MTFASPEAIFTDELWTFSGESGLDIFHFSHVAVSRKHLYWICVWWSLGDGVDRCNLIMQTLHKGAVARSHLTSWFSHPTRFDVEVRAATLSVFTSNVCFYSPPPLVFSHHQLLKWIWSWESYQVVWLGWRAVIVESYQRVDMCTPKRVHMSTEA